MRGLLLLALAVLVPLAAHADHLPQPGPPTPKLATFAPTPTTFVCGKGQTRLAEGAPLAPRSMQSWAPPYAENRVTTNERYTFGVDAEGRVVDLKRDDAAQYWVPDSQAAIIASWRFATGAPASDCRLELSPTISPMAAASPSQLLQALIAEGRNATPQLRQALDSLGDCGRAPRRRPALIAYPDLRSFDDQTVDPPWAGVTYDIDADGAVRNVAIVTQHGAQAFADTAASSVAESRYQTGSPRKGCFGMFRARPKASPATSRPKTSSFDRPGDVCDLEGEVKDLVQPKAYPPAFAARRVGGWAYVRFDVAPWGQIGTVEVVASQPTPAFGLAAVNVLQGMRLKSAPATGYRGCVAPVIFAIPAIPDDAD